MRLLTKTTLYFLAAMVPLLLLGGLYLYQQFSKEMNHRMDEELISEEVQWIQYLQTEADIGTTFTLRTPEILIYPVDATASAYPTIVDDNETKGNSKILYRQLSHIVPINGLSYLITIRKTQAQKAVMEANVTRIMLIVFAGLLAVTMVFNWFISNKIWQPFRLSLQKIREAELQKMEAVHFENTNIIEFNELNASLNIMAGKIYDDYINMREFTENAAHEMQTPLAVVQSKMELLLQDANLNDNQVQAIMDSSTALNRLSKLNQSLLLLAKIENNQYETNNMVGLQNITQRYLKLFDELIKDKSLQVHTRFSDEFLLNLHPLLADSLISNLLGNAIKYNFNGGSISIEVSSRTYKISNTSLLPAINDNQLFKRFNKSKNNLDTSNGLGLAIVKKICDTHHLSILYESKNNTHCFIIQHK